ncbi:PRTRC system protein A [Flavobacterium sp.]|uniref:PRTRC system protein A n=1 Tax=Flavobacterium sp. TaxID=239 RepID=UPI0026383DE8|nr:PRTRC system protein A [Flavobacterium sp.]
MDIRDKIMQQQFPLVPVPAFSEFRSLQSNGQRLLTAKNGVFLEVKHPCFYVRKPVARLPFETPFGLLEEAVEAIPVPVKMIQQFKEHAQSQLPNEAAGRIVYIQDQDAWRLDVYTPKSVGISHVSYDIPALQVGDSLGVDIHSHGYFAPMFSKQDDLDDSLETKLAVVISFNKGNSGVELAARLCLRGIFIPLALQSLQDAIHFKEAKV